MSRKKESAPKPDKRKIPVYFRAVERASRPSVYHGYLVSDDGDNFVCYAVHGGEESVLKERSLDKREFSFSKISKDEFEYHARIGVSRLRSTLQDAQFDLDAAAANLKFAETKLKEILNL